MADPNVRIPSTETGSLIEGSQFNAEQKELEAAQKEALKQAQQASDQAIKDGHRAVDEQFTADEGLKETFETIRQQPDSTPVKKSPEELRKLLGKFLSGDANDILNGAKVTESAEALQNLANNSQISPAEQSPEQI